MSRTLAALWDRLPFVGRLLVTATLALTVAASAMLYTVAREEAGQARRDMNLDMSSDLAILPATLGDWIVIGDFSVLKQSTDRFVRQEGVVSITYRAIGGATVVSRDTVTKGTAPEWFARWFDVADSVGTVAVTIGERVYGTIEVGLTAQPAIDRAWGRLARHLSILVFAIVMDFLGIWLVLRHGLKPLSDLHRGAKRLKGGDLSARLVARGSPELRSVVETFNDMAATLESDRALLAREKEYLQVTLRSIGDGVVTTDADGLVEFMNPTAEALSGWTATKARGVPLSDVLELVDAKTDELLECPVSRVFRERDAVTLPDDVALIRRGDRGTLFVATIAAPIRDREEGAILGTVLVFRDQTEKLEQQHRLDLLASVVKNASESVVITQPDTTIIDINQAFTDVTGYTRDEVMGRKISLLKSGRHDNVFYQDLWKALDTDGVWHGEIFNRRKSGEIYVEMTSISAVRDSRGAVTHYFALFSDITQLKDQQRQLEHLAYFDALTGLPNRRMLADRFHIALSQTQRDSNSMAVCYLDLDGFKALNDRLGHGIGDQLLIEVAARLTACIRGGDTVARLGGDEFVLVLAGFDRDTERDLALDRILASLSAPFSLSGNDVQISASIGVSRYPDDLADDLDTLLRHADQAMYVAKQGGRNRWHVFDIRLDRAVQAHQEKAEGIRLALGRGEFRLYYQPKVNMRSGAVIGAEALIRWQHPERGLVSPAEFLPSIEDSAELSIAVGDWVIGEALRQMEVWRQEGLTVPVSVNISAQHMQHPDFMPNLARELDRYPDLSSDMIEIEVLESSALDDVGRASAVIRECRQRGVKVSLDDFGTGYSSLTYLRRLPVGMIKIDQTFVREMLTDQDDTAIVEGVIGLAKAFGRDVIAEGVESVAHGVLLLQMGCELAQGYGIARPMPADSLPHWLADWRPDLAWTAASAKAWPQEDLPLLYAAVAHRHWVDKVLSWLDGTATLVSFDGRLDDAYSCAFGRWYFSRGLRRYGHLEAFKSIDLLHQKTHALGAELAAMRDTNPTEARNRAVELLEMRDRLLASLGTLRSTVYT
jgi:diguanylate cyclase (GGDEF)-like protein/PAS domain S-box-containing protein